MESARGFDKVLKNYMFDKIQKEVKCIALIRAVLSTSLLTLFMLLCTVHCELLCRCWTGRARCVSLGPST